MLDRIPLARTRGIVAHGNDKAVDSGNGLVEAVFPKARPIAKPELGFAAAGDKARSPWSRPAWSGSSRFGTLEGQPEVWPADARQSPRLKHGPESNHLSFCGIDFPYGKGSAHLKIKPAGAETSKYLVFISLDGV
jgi:hypothetical protein